jgi:hypothetical protein
MLHIYGCYLLILPKEIWICVWNGLYSILALRILVGLHICQTLPGIGLEFMLLIKCMLFNRILHKNIFFLKINLSSTLKYVTGNI